MDLLNLCCLRRISNNICQVNYSSNLLVLANAVHHTRTCRLRVKCSGEGTIHQCGVCPPSHVPWPVCTLSPCTQSPSAPSLSTCKLMYTLFTDTVMESACGLPRPGSSLKLTRSPKLFATQRMAVGIPTNIHSQFTEVYCSYLPDIPMVY